MAKSIIRSKKQLKTSVSMQKINETNSKNKMIRLICNNFVGDDSIVTLRYNSPPTEKNEIIHNFQNLLKRIRYHSGINNYDFKYIAIAHLHNTAHYHFILNNECAQLIDELWKEGDIEKKFLIYNGICSLNNISNHLLENNIFSKRWCASKNLKH